MKTRDERFNDSLIAPFPQSDITQFTVPNHGTVFMHLAKIILFEKKDKKSRAWFKPWFGVKRGGGVGSSDKMPISIFEIGRNPIFAENLKNTDYDNEDDVNKDDDGDDDKDDGEGGVD